MSNPFIEYWYFHIPNYVLALVMYTLLARFILSFFLPPDSRNYIFRAFCALTNWFLAPVRFLTPAMVPHMLLLLFAVVWAVALRYALYFALTGVGLAPTIS
ncbi:MAG: YggT family protein [Rhodobiaceae bacterium]|nr:YggT family protein [Rhodobiaceae bacterium]MCC0055065.1 YggT family protein [Rhodobiaceae bacterium]